MEYIESYDTICAKVDKCMYEFNGVNLNGLGNLGITFNNVLNNVMIINGYLFFHERTIEIPNIKFYGFGHGYGIVIADGKCNG